MATVIFAHFGASTLGLVLRTQSRPFLRCVSRCVHCLRRCCCCTKSEPVPVESNWGLKWYWFHLSAQVAFALRELIVTSSLRWTWELIFVNSAYWLTLAITIREVWCFSTVRRGSETTKVAVDGLLDMLLLPVNIMFFCDVCVRVLLLQPESQLAGMVPVIIECGDIYEAFALWSVLKLFVQVVQAEMGSDQGSVRSFKAFKAISLQGVKAWVWIQTAAVVLKLALRGIVAVYIPTLCYWASKSCTSCETWYEENVATALTAVTFLLCSFAIMFVFYFESGYRNQLEKTEPLWKFLGVKGIVSVTYFQWLVISALASFWHWPESKMYLVHCLLYASWMPLLAIVHTFLAYPFYRFASNESAPWLVSWLRTLQQEPEVPEDPEGVAELEQREMEAEATVSPASAMCESEVARPDACDTEIQNTDAMTPSTGIDDSRTQGLLSPPDARGRDASQGNNLSQLRVAFRAWSTIFHILVGLFACFVSFKALLTLIPVDHLELDEPLRNISCSGQGDLAHFLETRSDLHFDLLNDTVQRWSSPGVAGAWLPLCSQTLLGCAPGHFHTPDSTPSLSCSAKGFYTWQGSCGAISCGAPPPLPHATPRMSDIKRQNWTYGVTIHYDCDKPGYWGSLSAHCNVTGTWIVEGACVEVTCSTPPMVPHAQALWDPSEGNVSTGIVVRYQCDEMYNGTPTASCGDDGMYMVSGRCRRECGPPPKVDHAAPRFNNSDVEGGWFVGMRCPYVCNPGYHGFVTAVCEEGGNYSVSGHCAPVLCGAPPKLPKAAARMEDVTKQNFSFGALVHYTCLKPRYRGRLLARCLPTSRWEINGSCQEVTCGQPPVLSHASLLEPEPNVTAGTVVRYQCDETYNGTPSATCGYDGQYVTVGRCRKECLGTLPAVPFAAPKASEPPPEGWLSGMGVPYDCEPGYDGTVTAMCTSDGNYTVEGHCKTASSVETRSLRSKLTGVSTAMGVENALILAGLGLFGWQRYRRVRLPSVRDASLTDGLANGANEMEGMSGPGESQS